MFYVKVVDLLTTYQMPFAVCRSDVWFFRSEGGGRKAPPAQNRTFQSPPGIGLKTFPIDLLHQFRPIYKCHKWYINIRWATSVLIVAPLLIIQYSRFSIFLNHLALSTYVLHTRQ